MRRRKGEKGGQPAVDETLPSTPPRSPKGDGETPTKLAPESSDSRILFFLLFFASGLCSAFFNVAFDCDEIYNYWEPTHYLMYNFGFQTWEYSPVYGLRSYAYILIHATIGSIIRFFVPSYKSFIFFGVKILLGAVCAACETYFVSAISRRFGSNVSFYTSIFLLFSPGLFISSTSFLPSSFAMYCLLVAYGAWFDKNYFLATFSSACAALLGWPFVLLIIFPIAIDALIQCRFLKVLQWSIFSAVVFVLPALLIDFYFYREIFFAPINIVLYNFLNQAEGGSALYGVEPPSYYFMNCFLNFNVAFVLALPAIPIVLVFRRWTGSLLQRARGKDIALYLSPMYMWFGFMTYLLEHKEERFLFVIYPLFCLAASLTLVTLLSIFGTLASALTHRAKKTTVSAFLVKLASIVFCAVFIALSVSRCASLYHNFRAPFDVYSHLEREELGIDGAKCPFPSNEEINVCVGKEWYRFTSNFYLPSKRFHLQFLKSGFGGQLPKPFEEVNGTWTIPTNMNSYNQEEWSRYVNPDDCHYIVDVDEVGQQEESYKSMTNKWETLFEAPFLFAKESRNPFFRAFWVPGFSKKYNKYSSYVLLRKLTEKK